ncbi:delta-60 repeat domain-containing protein [Pseudomonas sp.]|uniref:delta-60 repeat domain-containing protein n=1 Tax=Pseudomonas sp. TaxID=306 RepID=UPI003F2B27DA
MDTEVKSSVAQPSDLDVEFGRFGVAAPDPDPGTRGFVRALVADESSRLIYALWVDKEVWLYRTLADGSPDPDFAGGIGMLKWSFAGANSSRPTDILLQPDGKILLIGLAIDEFGQGKVAITRFHASGSSDLVFGNRVLTFPPQGALDIRAPRGCLQSDGGILIVNGYYVVDEGEESSAGWLISLRNNGELNDEFGGGGKGYIDVRFEGQNSLLSSVVVQSNGAIVVGGELFRVSDGEGVYFVALACYDGKGELNLHFGKNGIAIMDAPHASLKQLIAYQDRLVIVGSALAKEPDMIGAMVMIFNANGEPDPLFNGGLPVLTLFEEWLSAWTTVVAQPDEKIVVAGMELGNPGSVTYARLLLTGQFDNKFGNQGIRRLNQGTIFSAVFQRREERIVLGGGQGLDIGEACLYGILS